MKDSCRKIVIGIDQSYKNTGISISADGKLKTVTGLKLDKLHNNTERRAALADRLEEVYYKLDGRADKLMVICERIRLSSQGFVNINYIKSIGALNATIVDVFRRNGVDVFSVDTRAWKSQVVGTSKPQPNDMGVEPEKWPTVKHVINLGFERSIMREVSGQKKKGVFVRNGIRYVYDDDAADSACISLYGFIPKNLQKLEEEH